MHIMYTSYIIDIGICEYMYISMLCTQAERYYIYIHNTMHIHTYIYMLHSERIYAKLCFVKQFDVAFTLPYFLFHRLKLFSPKSLHA